MCVRAFAALCLLFLAVFCWQSSTASADVKFALPESDTGLPGAGPIRRYDWFRNLWKSRRGQFLKEAPTQQGAVVFLGDSITQGWGEKLSKAFPGMKVANRGISGDTTRGMLIRLADDVLALRPSAVVLLMGTNDLEEGATPEVISANTQLIIATLKEHNATMPVILCNVFPSSASKKRPANSIKKINLLNAAAVKGDAQVHLIDTWTLFANKAGDAKPEEFPDLLHPNAAGYAKWQKALAPIFATLQFTETATSDWVPDDGFRSLFNGQDLSGWQYLPTTAAMLKSRERWQSRDPNAPAWPVVKKVVSFDGEDSSSDGRYRAINGRLVVTAPPEGRKIQQLWTNEEFGSDFTLKLQFRATPNADSGVFIRAPQLQCRDFVLAGPYKDLVNYKAQDWNSLEVVVRGLTAHCTCNGEVLEAAFKVPETGPIGLEGDRGQIEYRHLQIRQD